jgi:pentose-5-phosphate-3-epimerase
MSLFDTNFETNFAFISLTFKKKFKLKKFNFDCHLCVNSQPFLKAKFCNLSAQQKIC